MRISEINTNTPVQEVLHPALSRYSQRLFVKRDDLIHPEISGNKWRKLKFNILEAQNQGVETILTYGGAFSNHIVATAAACQLAGLRSIGIIRGEEVNQENPTLSRAKSYGMELHFVTRTAYSEKESEAFKGRFLGQFGRFLEVPEGGANELGVKGCKEIIKDLPEEFDYIAVAVGTGTTYRGLLEMRSTHNFNVLGFPVLKGFEDLAAEVLNQSGNKGDRWFHDFHFGGYAKWKPELVDFINDFKAQTGISLDPIYTGKMMYGVFNLLGKGYFKENTKILAIHTGGLQGIEGFNQRFGKLIE